EIHIPTPTHPPMGTAPTGLGHSILRKTLYLKSRSIHSPKSPLGTLPGWNYTSAMIFAPAANDLKRHGVRKSSRITTGKPATPRKAESFVTNIAQPAWLAV